MIFASSAAGRTKRAQGRQNGRPCAGSLRQCYVFGERLHFGFRLCAEKGIEQLYGAPLALPRDFGGVALLPRALFQHFEGLCAHARAARAVRAVKAAVRDVEKTLPFQQGAAAGAAGKVEPVAGKFQRGEQEGDEFFRLVAVAHPAQGIHRAEEQLFADHAVVEQRVADAGEGGGGVELADIPAQGRISAGVRGIALGEGDKVVFAGQIDGGEIIVATDGNTIKKVIASQIDPMARYRKGVKIVELAKGSKIVYSDYVTEPYKFAVLMDDKTLVQADTEEDIAIMANNTKGKNIKLKKGCKAVAFWSLKYLKS